jgi:hypothetical protein
MHPFDKRLIIAAGVGKEEGDRLFRGRGFIMFSRIGHYWPVWAGGTLHARSFFRRLGSNWSLPGEVRTFLIGAG